MAGSQAEKMRKLSWKTDERTTETLELEIKAEVKVESTLKSVRQMTSQPKAIQVNYAANVEKLLIKF